MKYPLIASKLYCEPWCIRPEVHQAVCQQFRAKAGFAVPNAGAADPVGPRDEWSGEYYHPQVEVSGDLALIRVSGIIGKHLSQLEMVCGGYDLALFEEQLRNVEEDERIEKLVIYFNTPGGVGIGVGAAARAIRRVSEAGKMVLGYTDYQCCSAGMWLAAACDQFHAEPSAYVGSISTFIAAIDSSRAWEMEGYELKLFRTGELKAIGAGGKKWTEEEENFMQATVDRADAEFKGWMRERRGLRDEVMNGAFWQAGNAPAGVVDSTSFSSLRDAIEAMMML